MIEDELDRLLSDVARYGGICFPAKLKVYAPTCNNTCVQAVEKLYRRLTELFGGATVYKGAIGTFVDPERGVVEEEPVWVIEAAHNCLTPAEARSFAKALTEYASETKQNYIAVSQGSFYVLPSEALAKRFKT